MDFSSSRLTLKQLSHYCISATWCYSAKKSRNTRAIQFKGWWWWHASSKHISETRTGGSHFLALLDTGVIDHNVACESNNSDNVTCSLIHTCGMWILQTKWTISNAFATQTRILAVSDQSEKPTRFQWLFYGLGRFTSWSSYNYCLCPIWGGNWLQ